MYSSSNAYCDGDEGVNLHSSSFKCLYKWVIFGNLFARGGYAKLISLLDNIHLVHWPF